MEDQTRNNLTNKAAWMRLIYIVLFAIAFNIAEILIAIITVVQFFTVLFTKTSNPRLQTLGGDLGEYIRDVVGFLTYRTDHMPYPVSDWVNEPEPKPKPKPKPKRKTAAKRTVRKNPGADATASDEGKS